MKIFAINGNFIVNSDVLMMDFDLEQVLRKFDKVKRLATVAFTTNEASIFCLPHLKNQDTWFAEYKKIPTKKQFSIYQHAIGHSFFVRSDSALKGRLPFNNLFSPGYGEETEMSLWLSDKERFSHKLFSSGHFHGN